MNQVSESRGLAGFNLFHLFRPENNARWTMGTVGKSTFPTVLSVRKMDTH